MGDLSVKYNGTELTPTPLVSRGYQFIDLGGRFGQVESIDLQGFLTGIGTDYRTSISALTSVFTEQFKTLEVTEAGAGTIYTWPNVVVQEINIPQNHFVPNGFTTYNVKLASYQIPSGVIDPVNEYSFSQGEDGTVTVNHRISAKGVRTSNAPIDNAISFVTAFLRKNPYNNCAPAFINNSSGVLMSISETVDRANGTYGVTEIYKFVTGAGAQAYLKTTNLSVNETPSNEYVTLDLTVNLQGSPVDSNLSELKTAALALDLNSILSSEYGIATTNVHRENYSVNQNSGAVSIEIKSTFISGVSSDISGYFDYGISFDRELVPYLATWRIDGEYISRGPMNYKQSQISSFKTANQGGGYAPYLKNLVSGSPLFAEYGSGFALTAMNVNVSEDTGRATLKLSATFSDYDTFSGLVQPKYRIDVEPSRWIYEMIPAANIEGHYVIQDLQMKNQARISIGFESVVTGQLSGNLVNANNIVNTLSGIYVDNPAFMTTESLNSGLTNIAVSKEFLGTDTMTDALLTTKTYGVIGNNYVRRAGFKFGY